jgi:hypothetical protein
MLKPAPGAAAGAAPSTSGNRQKQRKKTGNANPHRFICLSLNRKEFTALSFPAFYNRIHGTEKSKSYALK